MHKGEWIPSLIGLAIVIMVLIFAYLMGGDVGALISPSRAMMP